MTDKTQSIIDSLGYLFILILAGTLTVYAAAGPFVGW